MPHVLIKHAHVLICIYVGKSSQHFSVISLPLPAWAEGTVLRPYQFNNLVLGIALSDFFENVKKNISLHLARNWIEKCIYLTLDSKSQNLHKSLFYFSSFKHA